MSDTELSFQEPEDYQEHGRTDQIFESYAKTEKCADFVTWRGIV